MTEAELLFTEPKPRLDRWHYEQFVGKTWAALSEADWEGTFTQYCDLLREYLDLDYPNNKKSGNSYSSSWLSDVENASDNIAPMLVATISKIGELALSSDFSRLKRILQILEQYRWDVFRRIELHLLRRWSHQAKDEVKVRLMNSDTFRDRNLFHEYSLLLSDVFDELDDDQQKTILEWVDTFVPSVKVVQERVKRWHGNEISDEDAEWEIRRVKLRWLEILKDKLPEDWRRKHEEWTQYFGGPVRFGTPSVQAMWVAEPPVREFLVAFSSPKEILEYLADVSRPQSAPDELASELSELVSKNPSDYIDIFEDFRNLETFYVRAFFSGVKLSRQEIPAESWPYLLESMQWVLDRHSKDESTEWSEIRSFIGDIISSHLKNDEGKIPFDSRGQVWSVIAVLTDDPNPSVEYEAQYGGKNMDPLTLSLNTTRGEAFHTVFKYVNWCRQVLNIQESTLESTAEVLPVLEKHLTPSVEPSLAVRAVYGELLPSLIALDPDWVKEHLAELFPVASEHSALYKATWETFIVWTRPYDNVYEMLKEQYSRALDHLQEESLYSTETAPARLSEHLTAFFARGIIELDEGSVFQRFYETASGPQAAHVFWFIARIVREQDVPPQVLQRFVSLIERRVRNGSADELTAFGWLFSSGKFDAEWSLQVLNAAVASTKQSDPDHSVIEHLSTLSMKFPKLAISVVSHLVDGADTEWKLQYWEPHLRTIIAAAVAADERELAALVVNKLAARNMPHFRNLLQTRPDD